MLEYVPQDGDDDITTLRVAKRIRRKLGMLMNGNENIDEAIERIFDDRLKKA